MGVTGSSYHMESVAKHPAISFIDSAMYVYAHQNQFTNYHQSSYKPLQHQQKGYIAVSTQRNKSTVAEHA